MQNIQKLYQDLHEGKISRNQFLFQIRKDSRINSFFTSANSYDETVRILKNRGLLFEIKINESIEEEIGSNDPETSFEEGEYSAFVPEKYLLKLSNEEKEADAYVVRTTNIYGKDDPSGRFQVYTIGRNKQYDIMENTPQYSNSLPDIGHYLKKEGFDIQPFFDKGLFKKKSSSTDQQMPSAPSQEETDANQVYENKPRSGMGPRFIDWLKNYIQQFGERAGAVKLVDGVLKSVAGVESSDMPDTSTFANGVDEIQSLLEDQDYDAAYQMAKDTANEMLEEEGYGGLNEAKEPTKGADQVNPYELEKGTYYEMDYQKDGAKDPIKAKAKALKNLNKNPKYYSDLLSKDYNDKPSTSDQMQVVKESLKNLIDDILSEN